MCEFADRYGYIHTDSDVAEGELCIKIELVNGIEH